jgi:hypothetical protein
MFSWVFVEVSFIIHWVGKIVRVFFVPEGKGKVYPTTGHEILKGE